MSSVTRSVCVAVLLFLSEEAAASLITDHSKVYIFGQGSQNPDTGQSVYFNTAVTGDSTLLSGSGFGTGAGHQTVSATVHAEPSPFLLSGHASASADAATSGRAVAAGSWRDIVFLTGGGSPPPTVKLTFHVTGTVVTAGSGQGTQAADFNVYLSSDIKTFGVDSDLRCCSSISVQRFNLNPPLSVGFTTISLDPTDGAFSGSFTYIAPYSPLLGGYPFQVTEFATNSALGGSADTQWNDPLQVDFVTNANGSPLSGFAVSFDSGLQLAAQPVPEMSSIFLLGAISCAGLGWVRRRRRREHLA